MDANTLSELTIADVYHLPIVKEYARQINLVATVNSLVDTEMDLDPGTAVLAMVLDTLSGRTPLYRLKEFFENKDTELLLGKPVDHEIFTDYNIGRVLDKIYETGTHKIFSQLSQNAIGGFQINTKAVHYDTTSISVFGDYDYQDPPLEITYGHSKDKRPDLKQFMVELLCVDRNIPLFGATRDGNSSDKTLNNELLGSVSTYMAKHGLDPNAYVYVADAAFTTKKNIIKAHKEQVDFISRLPASYNACSEVIEQAVRADNWTDIGTLATTEPTDKRPAAFYRYFETELDLHDIAHRAIVVHSSAHDKRRHKRIDRLLAKKQTELENACKKAAEKSFFCASDAQQAAETLCATADKSGYHSIETTIAEVARYKPGRPANGQPRVPERFEYVLETRVIEEPEKIKPLRKQAGCFVLITNLTSPEEQDEWTGVKLLKSYKEQIGVEQNFGFLKDPAIVNSIFLKKPKRIEVLGLILIIALLLWRLMERSLRQYVQPENKTLPGWKKLQTKRPTSFMMSTKFHSIIIVTSATQRHFARPLNPVQLEYLKALNVSPDVFTSP